MPKSGQEIGEKTQAMTKTLKIFWIVVLIQTSVAAQQERKGGFILDFPEGTQFFQQGDTLNFTLPSGYYLIGIDAEGSFHRSAEPPNSGGTGGVTCICTSGSGGCNPVYSDGTFGCLMVGCDDCSKRPAFIRRADGSVIAVEEMMIASVYESSSVVAFSQIQGRLLLPYRFIDALEVSGFLSELEQAFLPSNATTKKTILLIHLGYIIPISVPSDIDDVSLRVLPVDDEAGFTCRCNTSGSCVLKKKLIVIYCDAPNCSSCTMTGALINNQGEVKAVSIVDGRIQIN